MKFKRMISLTLAAALVLSVSMAAWAAEVENAEIAASPETEAALIVEEAETVDAESEETEAELSQSDAEEGYVVVESDDAEIEDMVEILEEEETAEDIVEAEEDEDSEDVDAVDDEDDSPSTDTSGDTEICEENPALIGYIDGTSSGIQPLAETEYTPYTNYTYSYQTFTTTVDGHSGDEILDMAVDIIVANEGSYNTVLANDNNSGALSVGKIGWHANYALTLVRLIVVEDNAKAWELLGKDLYNEIINDSTSWSSRVLTTSEVTKFKNFLDPDQNPASKTIQDKLARSYIASYVTNGYSLGLRNAAALVYYADIENQYGYSGGSMGGSSACSRYAQTIAGSWSKVTLNELHLAAMANVSHNFASRSNVGSYLERRRSTYGKLATSGWTYCNSGDYIIPYDSVWSSGSGGSAWLQVALNTYTNAGLTVTGVYDDALRAAVKAYQQAVGLDADGLAGLHTTTKLIHDMYYTPMTTGADMGSVTVATGEDIVLINGTWTYTVDGTPDYSYTGFAKNSNGWWYVESGKVTFSKNSVIQDTNKKINGKSDWWYVVGSQVQTNFTGLADYSNSNGWWYIENGKVTFTANTVAQNKNGWYYVEDSKVDFNYNGFAQNSNGWWYIENGKVTFSKNSVIQDTYKKINGKSDWWYVVGSQVQTNFTGLADYSNSNGWWYIENGKVTFTKDTIAKNKNGWYYVKDSKVDFSFTGLADFPNENGWWYIESGKVTFTKDTIAKNKNGWYYVKDSKVDFSFTGLADFPNENGWWYIENGKVNFDKNTVAQNKNGWYYIKDSKVDFSFNGIAQNSNGWWYIKNGKVDFSFTGTVTVNGTKYSVSNGKVDK